jgi:hypothetical protein
VVVPLDWLTPPVPASAALTVPPCSAKVPEEDSVPFWIVPPASVTPPFCVWLVPPRSSVPSALTVVLPLVSPSVPLPASASVPPSTTVPPV